jgi:hypothetical protein
LPAAEEQTHDRNARTVAVAWRGPRDPGSLTTQTHTHDRFNRSTVCRHLHCSIGPSWLGSQRFILLRHSGIGIRRR